MKGFVSRALALVVLALTVNTGWASPMLLISGLAPAFQQDPSSGLLVVEAEHFDLSVSQGGHDWVPASDPGASADGSLVTTPDSETNRNSDFESNSPRLDYLVRFTQPGTYYVWVRGLGPESRDDSLHVGLDGSGQASSDRITGFGTAFGWSSATMDPDRATLVIPAAGEYTLNAWMREDGLVFDKLLLTPDAGFIPDGLGPAESPRTEPQPLLVFDTGSLSFDVDEGSGESAAQSVNLVTSDGEAADVTLETSASWLSVAPDSGAAPLNGIQVRVDATGLAAGEYSAQVTAGAAGYPDGQMSVDLVVRGDAPPGGDAAYEAEDASAGGGTVFANRKAGFTGSGYMELRSKGSLEWTVDVPASGVYSLAFRYSVGISDRKVEFRVDGVKQAQPTVFPATGSWSAWSDVTVDVSLAAGTHTLSIKSTQNRGPNLDQLRIASSGPAAPALAFDDDALAFSVDEDSGLSAPQLLGLGTSDGSVASATLDAGDSWLKISPASGTTPLTGIEVRVDATGLAPGSYSSTVTASAPGFTGDSVTVSLQVAGSGPPPGGGDETIYETEAAALSGVTIRSSYGGFTGTGYGDFRGAASATWTIAVPSDGRYTLAFRYAVGIKDRKATVTVDGTAIGSVTLLPSTGAWTNWAEIEFEQDLTAGSHSVRLSTSQNRGPNVDHLRVTGAGGGGNPPTLVVNPESLSFSVAAGGSVSAPKALSVSASDGGSPQITLTPSQPWVLLDTSSGTAPLNGVNVRIDSATLSTGTRSATILAEAPGYTAVSVQVQATVTGTLPVVYDFNDGDASAWTVVQETADIPDWQVQGGRYVQQATASGSITGSDTYLEGTYSHVSVPGGGGDYAVSVDVESLETSILARGDDIGLLFRRADDSNFYRLSLNSRFGYTRLERVINNQTTTMAVTSQGYRPGNVVRLGVRVEGPLILVYREDEGDTGGLFDQPPYLAAWDDNIAAGGIGLYTRSGAAFDNVRIDSLAALPRVGVSRPVPFDVIATEGDISVEAVAQGAPNGASVRFEVNGDSCDAATEFRPGVFRATCPAPAVGENSITAVLLDGNVELDRHDQGPVGFAGDKALNLGDSITQGISDNYLVDGISQPVLLAGQPVGPRQISFRGYQSPLADGLDRDAGFNNPIVFFNEGIPGVRSDGLLIDRLPSILERHAGSANLAFLQIGTNDANRNELDPGLGCSGAGCDGTFKGYVLDTVLTLRGEGIEPFLARIPPIFGRVGRTPYSDPLGAGLPNERVIAYNEAIDELVQEFSTGDGPDFFDFFLGDGENRISLIDDNIHPNALGYRLMAWLWHQSVRPGGEGPRPLVLENICVRTTSSACRNPLLYKQNLLEPGNPYYVDRDVVVTDIPAALAEGVFLSTENDHKTVTRTDYLEFTVDRDVDVYVAFPPNVTTVPGWMGGFEDTGESLGVSAGAPTLKLYRATYGPGAVVLGGPGAAGVDPTPSNNYIVVVVPR